MWPGHLAEKRMGWARYSQSSLGNSVCPSLLGKVFEKLHSNSFSQPPITKNSERQGTGVFSSDQNICLILNFPRVLRGVLLFDWKGDSHKVNQSAG